MKHLLLLTILPLFLSTLQAEDRLGETKEQLVARWGKAIPWDSIYPPATESCRFNPQGGTMWVEVQFWENKACRFNVYYNDDQNPLQTSDIPLLLAQLAGGVPWKTTDAARPPSSNFIYSFEREDGSVEAKFYSSEKPKRVVIETTAFKKARQDAKNKARTDAIKGL